jgi:predicted unusual protein kinase regulating ubiquinone biosynthesis (AarF/ABC1/UbiB family)
VDGSYPLRRPLKPGLSSTAKKITIATIRITCLKAVKILRCVMMVRKQKTPKKEASALSRLMSIGKLGLDVAKSEAGYHVKRTLERNKEIQKLGTQLTQIRMVTKTLGEMKGAVMKIGQMLSLYDLPGLPEEVREILSQLQKQAPALPFEDMMEAIAEDIPDFFDTVKLESETPIAAASIGQVYKGTVNGQEVAIKVQIPGMSDIIKSDLKNLNTLAKVFSPWISQKEMKALLNEIKDHLLIECDYFQEAKNIEKFRKIYAKHPHIVFPSYLPELSDKHILTMTFVHGDDLKSFLKTNPSQKRRNEVAHIIFEFYMDQIFNHNMVHADPQFGNFLFQDNKIGVVDYGCVKYFDDHFIHNIVVFLNACFNHDKTEIHAGFRALGLATTRSSKKMYDLLDDFITIAEETYQRDKYQYGEYKVIHKIFQALPRLLTQRNLHYPPELLMLERTMAGVYFLAEKLKATVPFRSMLMKYVRESDAVTKGYKT